MHYIFVRNSLPVRTLRAHTYRAVFFLLLLFVSSRLRVRFMKRPG